MKLNKWFMLAGAGIGLVLGGGRLVAQPQIDWANLNPEQIQQQIQQRMLESLRDRMVVTNDDEWNVISPRLTKVMQMQMERFISSMGTPGMGMGGRGGGGPGRGAGFLAMFGKPSPELQTLQQAIDVKASTTELKGALTRFLDARKRKLAELRQAQADLREVLTLRQEGTLTLAGLLD